MSLFGILLILMHTAYCWDIGQYTSLLLGVDQEITKEISLIFYKSSVDDISLYPLVDAGNILSEPSFNSSKPTVFFFHGWTERPSTPNPNIYSTYVVCNALISKGGMNVIALNYENLVQQHDSALPLYIDPLTMGVGYASAVENATYIGKAIGIFLKQFAADCQCNGNIKLVGFSLGAQIMSYVALEYGLGLIPQITALDAAGPLYYLPEYQHLNKSSGVFVDAIHTDAGIAGYPTSFAHADFWPNRGHAIQPYCYGNSNVACDHYTSVLYYAASILQPDLFKAVSCDNELLWSTSMCKTNPTTNMGWGVSTNARGNFYLRTSDSSPFGLGNDGINA